MSGGAIIQWAQLLPAGPHIDARDGRSWAYDHATVIAAFRANSGPLAVDYEHAQDLLAPRERPRPLRAGSSPWKNAMAHYGDISNGQSGPRNSLPRKPIAIFLQASVMTQNAGLRA
ncbi:hypothetical protein HED55_00225 [Ochrobactrum haematophilum]|uniref:Uncharacterized protein n=1 Tax=Brucella haematophila TaxID=419474 RepID=A0ABX1DJF7_9HYPH|nr:hypothetical protein [Brucella haematophila]